jgi:hypothetical protein
MKPELSIIIVNYNTYEHVLQCISSVRNFISADEAEIIVVDNKSSDRSIEKLIDAFPDVNLCLREVNDGFASGCDHGASSSQGSVLLFMNPDVLIVDDSIKLLIELLNSRTDAGIVSGVMTDDSGSPIYFYNDFPSLKWELFHLAGYGYDKEIKRLLSRNEITAGEMFEADWFHGAFLMMRRSDFINAGGFNENYFMYYEDVELCYRMVNMIGKINLCDPRVRFKHQTRSSLGNESNDNIYTFHMHRGKLLFLRNYGLARRSLIRATGFAYVISRILILPFWNKYRGHKSNKLIQLMKVLKLYLSRKYQDSSKFEYING